LLKYWLSLTGKEDPVVCLLGTAQGDHPETIVTWYETMNQLPCRARHLRLYGPTKNLRDFSAQLLPVDGIFVRGGNSVNMLAIWKAQGIDTILRTAWERGIVLAGESAGMVCWFEQGLSDSRPDRLTVLESLGWLKGSACPHFDTETQRRPTYQKMIADGELKEGLACDDEAALLFEGDRLVKAVASSPKASAYRVFRKEGRVVEEKMTMEVLGAEGK
jgi:peptidase E